MCSDVAFFVKLLCFLGCLNVLTHLIGVRSL